jgi:hypothetical protein
LSASTLFKSLITAVLATSSGNLIQPSPPSNATYDGVVNRGAFGTSQADVAIEINKRTIKFTSEIFPDDVCKFEGVIDKRLPPASSALSAEGTYECSDFSEGVWTSDYIKGFGGDAYVAIIDDDRSTLPAVYTGIADLEGFSISNDLFPSSEYAIGGTYSGVIKSADDCAGASFPVSPSDFHIARDGSAITFTQDAFYDGECRFTGTISDSTQTNLKASGEFECSNFDEGTWSTESFGLTSDDSALVVIEADVPSRGCRYTTKYAGIITSRPLSSGYFNPNHIDLVIPESLWESAPQSSLEHAIPVDFDNDGLMDLLIEQAIAWNGPGGNVPNDNRDLYAPSNVISLAFKQVETGVYQLATQSVFGKDIVEMGDLSRKVMTADVNSDGFADVLMCLTREDGREISTDEGYLNWSSRQKVVLSNGDGTYRVDDLGGDPQYQHGCTTAKMQDGSQHIVYGHNGSHSSATVYEYQAGQPVSVTGYPYLGGWDERALTPESASANSYSKYLMSNLTLGSEKGVKIFEQVDSQWLEYGTYLFGENRGAVDFIWQSNDGVQQQDMFWYDGHLRLSFTVSDSCEIRLSDEESVFVIKLDSMIVPESYVEPIDMDALEFDLIYTALAIRNGAIEELSLFDEEKSHPMGYSFLCGDMTADGYGDLSSIQLHNGIPVSFYKNDGNGDLVRVDVKGLEVVKTLTVLGLPSAERVWFEDINGDGIGDWLQASKGTMRINFGVKPQ